MTDSRLPILKALGDNTRYAIYLELARSPRPLSTSDIAESLALHPNTVRPHLERMSAFGDHRPARSAVAVKELPLGALIEIEAWAYTGVG